MSNDSLPKNISHLNITQVTLMLSAHLYFEDEQNNIYAATCDQHLLNFVAPFMQKCQSEFEINRWFFIRYADEGGCHIRLRILGEENVSENELRLLLSEAVNVYNQENPILRLEFVAYVPETFRYGGEEGGLVLSEKMFQCSSEITLAALAKIAQQNESARLGQGLLLMTVLVHAFLPNAESAQQLAMQYSEGYLQTIVGKSEWATAFQKAFANSYTRQSEILQQYIEATWEGLVGNTSLTPILDAYREKLLPIQEAFRQLALSQHLAHENGVFVTYSDAVSFILPSYIHMANNRLGISIPDEAYLAHLLATAIPEFV